MEEATATTTPSQPPTAEELIEKFFNSILVAIENHPIGINVMRNRAKTLLDEMNIDDILKYFESQKIFDYLVEKEGDEVLRMYGIREVVDFAIENGVDDIERFVNDNGEFSVTLR